VWVGFVFGCAGKFDPVGAEAMNSSRFLSPALLGRADEVIE
jgi:hypothetical protein